MLHIMSRKAESITLCISRSVFRENTLTQHNRNMLISFWIFLLRNFFRLLSFLGTWEFSWFCSAEIFETSSFANLWHQLDLWLRHNHLQLTSLRMFLVSPKHMMNLCSICIISSFEISMISSISLSLILETDSSALWIAQLMWWIKRPLARNFFWLSTLKMHSTIDSEGTLPASIISYLEISIDSILWRCRSCR